MGGDFERISQRDPIRHEQFNPCSRSMRRRWLNCRILVPGESAVSGEMFQISGKSGVPQTQIAGTPFTILSGSNSIRAVDAFYNTVSTNGAVSVSQSDSVWNALSDFHQSVGRASARRLSR